MTPAPTTVAGTEPYPWPYDAALAGPATALVLAGWDEEWQDRALDGVPSVTADATALAAAVRACGGLVVVAAHRGAVALTAPTPDEVVRASGVDAFHGSALDDVLRRAGARYLLVAGHGLEGPVHSTLRSANDRGYECLLLAGASSPLTTDCVVASSSSVCMSGGIFGAVGSVPAVLDALRTLAVLPSEPRTPEALP